MAGTRILNDRYEVGTPLGKGGMAHVYRGTDRVLDRTVAIKVLAGKYAEDDRFVARFRREAQAAAGLSHPNIVGVYDTGGDDGMHYIVMELVEGETLADVLRREGRLDPDRAVAIATEVATALHAAHERGLVHRDVKPGNVMIDRDGRVKVVDFGIARAAADDTLTQTGLVLGTAAYLSPEQAQGSPVDARSDVYSLGCVLFEMLTGRPPFEGDTPVAIAYKHVNEPSPHAGELVPSLPSHMDQALTRALEKDPDARFPTAEAFRQAIAAGADGAATAPIAAAGGDTDVLPPTADAQPTAVRPRRSRAWIPIALAAAAVLAVIGVVLAATRDPERAGRRGNAQEQPAEDPTTPAVASVGVALDNLENVVIEAVGAGQLTEETGARIIQEAAKAYEEYSGGDLDKALEALSHTHEVVDEAEAGIDDVVTSPEVAAALHGAIDAVGEAMQASAPATVEPEEEPEEDEESDEGNESPGNSENAPGHKKDKGKGKGED